MANQENISQHLAAERTFLAFFRTAISLISFGITINRFALYLLQQKVPTEKPGGLQALIGAENAGIVMVFAGGVLMLFAAFRFIGVSKAIEQGTYVPKTAFAIVTTGIVLLASAFSLAWLFSRP